MWTSLRGRFLVTAIGLGLVIAVIAFQSQRMVQSSHQQSTSIIGGYYGLHHGVEAVKQEIDGFQVVLRRVTAEPSGQTAQEMRRAWQRLAAKVRALASESHVREQVHFTGLGGSLQTLVARLGAQIGASGAGPITAPVSAGDLEEATRLVSSIAKITHLIERRVYDAIIEKTFKALETSDLVSKFIWGLGGAWLLVALAGFVAFEWVIRRPLLGIARAMEAEGRGAADALPLPAPRTAETATLVRAFDAMRAQVRSRQLRLEAVLDNTSDGIVTLDAHGVVESMNRAAQVVFGRTEDQAVGRRFKDVLGAGEGDGPWPPDAPDGAPGEAVVELRRPGGKAVQVSLKFSAFVINDRRLTNVMVADVTERQAMIDELTVLAERDPLTGLYNRRYFLEAFDRVCSRVRRGSGPPAALLSIDLDHFKFVNDTLGHQAGDQLLIEIAEKLSERERHGDLLARMGGDEFAVLVFDVDTGTADKVAASYCAKIADHPFLRGGRTLEIGCSIGVAMVGPAIGSMADVVGRADLACRIAKREGRNRHHLFREEDRAGDRALAHDLSIATRVRRAIAEDRLCLAFQPIVDLAAGETAMHEALVRLRDADDGDLIPAGAFISEAERVGLAFDIDRWVFRSLFAAMAAGTVPEGGGFALNLSAQTIGDSALLPEISAALVEYGVDPRRLVFELTETTAVSSLSQAREVLDGLKALGCRTALDDFGSGYCSFLYLRELPADFVKLDGSLVRTIDTDPVNLALVRAMHDVTTALGKTTVAEFVETPQVLERLRAIGVGYGQGYHFGAPAVFPDAEATALAAE